MIYIERGPVPKVLADDRLTQRYYKAINQRLQREPTARPAFFRHLPTEIPGFELALRQVFADKCAFCETKLHAQQKGTLHFFRPRYGTRHTKNGKFDPEAYFWLGWEWSNMYWICQACDISKQDVFPIKRVKGRANPGVYGIEELCTAEEPLLVDPCFDNPTAHLEFDEDGSVKPVSSRGQITIDTFELMRSPLCAARSAHAQKLKVTLKHVLQAMAEKQGGIDSWITDQVRGLRVQCLAAAEFAGMTRQLLWKWLQAEQRSSNTPSEVKTTLNATPWQELMNDLEQWLSKLPPPAPTPAMFIPVLAIFANPKSSIPLNLAKEKSVFDECIERSILGPTIRLKIIHAARVDDFARALLEGQYRIVHFSGHGTQDGLAFEDEDGEVQIVPQVALAETLSAYAPPLECVILNACYSDVHEQHFTSSKISYVIFMQGAISDGSAIEFTRGFYDAIGAEKDIEFAYQEGCRRLKMKARLDWTIPVLLSVKGAYTA